MVNTNLDQLRAAFECISNDLSSVQTCLATYEARMLEGDRVNPHVKEIVLYYRTEASLLRKEMLELIRLMAAPYKIEVLKSTRPTPPCSVPPVAEPVPTIPVPTVPAEPEVVAENPVEPLLEQDAPFNELPPA